jgi:ATP-dependent helicase HepA
MWHSDDLRYEIDMPNGQMTYVTELELYVRCNLPIEDPTEVLIAKGQETPYFYDRRSALLRCLTKQRAVSYGMTGLFSSSIDLYPHQVEVVRRVLEDPIQRYLLADEVGLGKTIEAGAILRQHFLDFPEAKALLILPKMLIEQWQQELATKFYIYKNVQFISVDELSCSTIDGEPSLVVIDEAHHVASMAFSEDAKQHQHFEYCRQLACKAKVLLLLSATPALNHEQAFLAMLHLLDPLTYNLDDLDGFREKVSNRQEIGRILLSFQSNSSSFTLKRGLNKLRTLFEKDSKLLELTGKLEEILNLPDVEALLRDQTVCTIRNHISDTYRLHRRMLRNRRTTVENVLRDQLNVVLRPEYDFDERAPEISRYLDEWRVRAISSVSQVENPEWYTQLQKIFLLLFQAGGTHLDILKWAILGRMEGNPYSELSREFGHQAVQVLIKTPLFEDEKQILNVMLEIICQPSEEGDRIQHLKMWIDRLCCQAERGQYPKILIFTSFVYTAKQIYNRFSEIYGDNAIASYHSQQSRESILSNTQKFKNEPQCFILVCDSSGEEGHNLQFANWMVHFDLPWSPNRLEQRIGRLNRIGLEHDLQFMVFAGADDSNTLHGNWFEVLRDGFNIFCESIASLQFYVDIKSLDLEKIIFETGAYGLSKSIEAIKVEIEDEHRKINEQNILDEIDPFEQVSSQYFQTLEEYDSCPSIQEVVDCWISNVLHFNRHWHSNWQWVSQYRPNYHRTLIPVDDILRLFKEHLNEFGTFDRRISIKNPSVKLYRIGENLIDSIASYSRWDDRGQTFAMWRHDESWTSDLEWLGFRFDYVVDANLADVESILSGNELSNLNERSIIRRADALFPPTVESIFLDIQLRIVIDPYLLGILHRPFSKKAPNRDYNIAKNRLNLIDEYISQDEWGNLCRIARETSENLLLQHKDFQARCEEYAQRADRELSDRIDRLGLRLERSHDLKLEQEIKVEMQLRQIVLAGIRQPKIRADSVGFYIISGKSPSQIMNGEENIDE